MESLLSLLLRTRTMEKKIISLLLRIKNIFEEQLSPLATNRDVNERDRVVPSWLSLSLVLSGVFKRWERRRGATNKILISLLVYFFFFLIFKCNLNSQKINKSSSKLEKKNEVVENIIVSIILEILELVHCNLNYNYSSLFGFAFCNK